MVAWRKERIETLYEVGIPMKEHRHAFYYSGSIDSGSNMSIPPRDRKRDQDAMKVTNGFANTAFHKRQVRNAAAARRLAVVIDSPRMHPWTEYHDGVGCNPVPMSSSVRENQCDRWLQKRCICISHDQGCIAPPRTEIRREGNEERGK